MREITDDDRLMRRFLLGQLEEEERERLEKLFLTDPGVREGLLMTENDLIEDYWEGSLLEDDRRDFLAQFLANPAQRRKVRIAKSIKTFVNNETPSLASRDEEEVLASDPKRHKDVNGPMLWRLTNPFVFVPLAAALACAIAIGGVWLFQVKRSNSRRAEEQARQTAIERELADLNAQPGNTRPGSDTLVLSTLLSPISLRSLEPSASVSLATNPKVVEVWLLPVGNEYQTYRAILQKASGAERFTISNLRIENRSGNKAIRVRIPVHLLTTGVYKLQLNGVTSDGKFDDVGEYNFVVTE